jgi:hypothetical protein
MSSRGQAQAGRVVDRYSRDKATEICANKIPYSTVGAARKALKGIQSKHRRHKRATEIGTYRCQVCGGWHLTKRRSKPRPPEAPVGNLLQELNVEAWESLDELTELMVTMGDDYDEDDFDFYYSELLDG